MHLLKTCVAIFVITLLSSCQHHSDDPETGENKISAQDSGVHQLPTSFRYDLSHPTRSWVLPTELVEVSGNTWIDKDHLILIEDLKPNLYVVQFDAQHARLEKTIPFAETEKDKVDIEDVTIVDNVIYALWSHGVLFKISDWQNKPVVEKIKTGLKKENNTEGLCFDPVTKNLLIACKDDPGTGDDSAKAVYSFDITTAQLSAQPLLLIHPADFKSITGSNLSFNPSAIAVHPVTHDIYILTTRDNKGMAVFTHDGKLRSYQAIDKELMEQPEGICFNPQGKLIISSEGKKGAPGNVFEFDAK
ncbi:MAG: hypothetical protein JWQ27_2725 [Ferruginibacter sp.]|nr:hypothetical protein [Ferruginibacter sp.]